MFTEQQLKVIEYCAHEVKRQGDGPVNVYDMLNAWDYAFKQGSIEDICIEGHSNWIFFDKTKRPLTLDMISEIGKLVEPNENPSGFRTIPIFVGNPINFASYVEKAKPDVIERNLRLLLEAYYEGNLDPEEMKKAAHYNESWSQYKYYKKAESAEDVFYFEFEQIHPFKDGNGRTGKILYNYLNGTMENPVMPPNFWGSSNP